MFLFVPGSATDLNSRVTRIKVLFAMPGSQILEAVRGLDDILPKIVKSVYDGIGVRESWLVDGLEGIWSSRRIRVRSRRRYRRFLGEILIINYSSCA